MCTRDQEAFGVVLHKIKMDRVPEHLQKIFHEHLEGGAWTSARVQTLAHLILLCIMIYFYYGNAPFEYPQRMFDSYASLSQSVVVYGANRVPKTIIPRVADSFRIIVDAASLLIEGENMSEAIVSVILRNSSNVDSFVRLVTQDYPTYSAIHAALCILIQAAVSSTSAPYRIVRRFRS